MPRPGDEIRTHREEALVATVVAGLSTRMGAGGVQFGSMYIEVFMIVLLKPSVCVLHPHLSGSSS